jgi:hypothetical protein
VEGLRSVDPALPITVRQPLPLLEAVPFNRFERDRYYEVVVPAR